MNKGNLKGFLLKLLSVTIVLLSALVLPAQNLRFIYIQTESKAPFYVKLDNQIISSTAGGYLVIPKLSARVYSITIGRLQSNTAVFSAEADVRETDAGYIIRDDKDQGWYLENLVTMELVPVKKQVLHEQWQEVIKPADEFARMLAQVVNDPSLNKIKVLAKPALAAVHSVVPGTPAPIAEQKITTTPAAGSASKSYPAGITRLQQKKTAEGYLSSYLDGNDTVNVFIPDSSHVTPAAVQQQTVSPTSNKAGADTIKDARGYDMDLLNSAAPRGSGKLVKKNAPAKMYSVLVLINQPGLYVCAGDFNEGRFHCAAFGERYESYRLASLKKTIFTS